MIVFAFILSIYQGFTSIISAESNEKVYIIPVEETVEKGLSQYIKRTVSDAQSQKVDHIILEIDTLGGAVDGAMEIADTLRSSEIPITAYINRRAISAGAYIALNANQIYMAPGSQMGSAAIITGDGNAADDKAQSLWLSEMRESAERNGRDPKYALAMADKDVDIPEYGAGKGDLLTLETKQALEVGYSEGTAIDRDDLLKQLGYNNAVEIVAEESFAEKVARFLTNPVVVPILLSIGSLGLVVELYSPGFGVPGSMGLAALLLFFYGHLVAGLAGMESIILFILGIIFIIAEFFVPGGILGIVGFVSIITSLYVASGDFVHMTISLLISFAVSITASILLVKVFGKRMNIFKKLILRDSTNTESGYVSNVSRAELVGAEGVALTTLRPSGTAIISDERLDVVTEGGYITKGNKVKVVKVEGSRIVVREL
ncbi:nodulation protein NfeD [Metabacillus sp. B2-18]|uniref:NfeD family protein n=1 Tax=Bacillus sp. AFS040349 TaxID=2033502 RepID=UPI001E36A0F6|nr:MULTISPECIES: nodulation protein NfeD [Bacillaceae]UGB33407.1 nodulation protein NfeD [Metabacillus sp. B2-18]